MASPYPVEITDGQNFGEGQDQTGGKLGLICELGNGLVNTQDVLKTRGVLIEAGKNGEAL
jgi:hypothetical protein